MGLFSIRLFILIVITTTLGYLTSTGDHEEDICNSKQLKVLFGDASEDIVGVGEEFV